MKMVDVFITIENEHYHRQIKATDSHYSRIDYFSSKNTQNTGVNVLFEFGYHIVWLQVVNDHFSVMTKLGNFTTTLSSANNVIKTMLETGVCLREEADLYLDSVVYAIHVLQMLKEQIGLLVPR